MNTKVIILVAVAILLVVGGNVVLTVFLLGDRDDADPAAGGEVAAGAATADLPLADPVYVRIDSFTVTFDSTNSARFLQIEPYVVVENEEAERQVERHMPALRAALVMLFADQTAEGLSTASGKERLRQEALEVTKEVYQTRVGQSLADDFLFTKFVMQ